MWDCGRTIRTDHTITFGVTRASQFVYDTVEVSFHVDIILITRMHTIILVGFMVVCFA